MTVCDHATGDVVFACSCDGSINDQTILPEIYLRMKFAGLDLTNNILVTDRGFPEHLQHTDGHQPQFEVHPVSEP